MRLNTHTFTVARIAMITAQNPDDPFADSSQDRKTITYHQGFGDIQPTNKNDERFITESGIVYKDSITLLTKYNVPSQPNVELDEFFQDWIYWSNKWYAVKSSVVWCDRGRFSYNKLFAIYSSDFKKDNDLMPIDWESAGSLIQIAPSLGRINTLLIKPTLEELL